MNVTVKPGREMSELAASWSVFKLPATDIYGYRSKMRIGIVHVYDMAYVSKFRTKRTEEQQLIGLGGGREPIHGYT